MICRGSYRSILVLLALLSLGEPHVLGQVDLIVKVRSDVEPVIRTWLEGGASKTSPLPRQLEQLGTGVSASSRLFAHPAGNGTHDLDRIYWLSTPDSSSMRLLAEAWSSRPDIAYAIPNRRYRIDQSGTPQNLIGDQFADSLTHLVLTRVPEAWSITRGNADVRIGFVDTGVFFEHPDLAGQFWTNTGEDLNRNGIFDEADRNGVDDDLNGFVDDVRGYDFVDRTTAVELGDLLDPDPDPDEDQLPSTAPGRGHGTNVAGILAAALGNGIGVAGVAPGARLVSLRAFANDGEGEDDDVARAIVYAADLGLEVLNLSFGDTYYSPLMHDAIRYAVSKGTVVIASAGNDGGDWPHYPSDYPEVISSGWLSKDGISRGFRASHGANLDLSAPATLTYTTLMPSTETLRSPEAPADSTLYGPRSGSSLAAPMVAGAAALLRSIDPTLSSDAIRAILTASATDVMDPGWDQWTGAGRLDVLAALSMAYPARVEIAWPNMDEGIADTVVAISGTAIAPLFDSFSLSFAMGDDEPDGRWQTIVESSEQVVDGTLGIWDRTQYPDTTYMLRLAVELKNGSTIEDRRRIYLDRSAPNVEIVIWDHAISAGARGIFAEIATDDVVQAYMDVDFGGRVQRVESDRFGRIGRRHGLIWTDVTGYGGPATASIICRNAAGLETTLSDQLFVIPARKGTPLTGETRLLETPGGYLMGKPADFDRDNLLEIVFNKYEELTLGDTVIVAEWEGDDFAIAGRILANVFPRDIGDTDGDGLLELLTQVSAVTLLLEQERADGLPVMEAFLDTTGIGDIDRDGAAWGTKLTELDGDGRGEILVHNRRAWRVLEWTGSAYEEAYRLENSTDMAEAQDSELQSDANGFSLPRALEADLNRDGRPELLVGDTDGDWIVYSCSGDNTCDVAWTYSTPRYNAGSRFAFGDYDGDGQEEFITYTDGWRSLRTDREYEAEYGIFYRFEAGEHGFALQDSLVFYGQVSNQTGLATADLEGDGRPQIVIGYPPDLYVFEIDDGWKMRDHWVDVGQNGARGVRSIFMVAADFDADGADEIIASTSAERMRIFDWSNESVRPGSPQWITARPLSSTAVLLAWYAPGVDSVAVWSRKPGEDFDPVATVSGDSLVLQSTAMMEYALQSWSLGTASAFSVSKQVRPHDPAVVVDTSVPDSRTIAVRFSQVLHANTRAHQFELRSGVQIQSASLVEGGRVVRLLLNVPGIGRDTLSWSGLTDSEDLPVGQTEVDIFFSEVPEIPLALVRWRADGLNTARLWFNKPLEGSSASVPENYRVEPNGRIASVEWYESAPDHVGLSIVERVLGATGKPTTIIAENLVAADGSQLGAEGFVATFAEAANTLDDVFVYPNPLDTHLHADDAMIAGLPDQSLVTIYALDGTLIRTLQETDGDGGVEWDLRDNMGSYVPSGIYLVRVEFEDLPPVLKKLAVIR